MNSVVGYLGSLPGGLPHSEIYGSKPVSGSPQLIAAVHVLLRLSSPRHPPRALIILIDLPKHVHERDQRHRNAYVCSKSEFDVHSSVLSETRRAAMGASARSLETRLPDEWLDESVASAPRDSAQQLPRKEVIQPQVPLRLPCYDFTPVMDHFLGGCPLAVGAPTSVAAHSHGVTGGVYKARERIHRCCADQRLLAIPTSRSRVADSYLY